jgi:signal peptidase II
LSFVRFFTPWFLVPIIVIVDFVSKRLVLANAELLRQKVEVIGELVRFVYVRNPGAAMGLFPIGRTGLITVSVLVSCVLVYAYLRSHPRRVVYRCALAVILGGALGNLIDRIFYGGLVVDFIDIGIGNHRFYTFNVADVAVTVGGAVLFLCLLLGGGKPAGVETSTESAPGAPNDVPLGSGRGETTTSPASDE